LLEALWLLSKWRLVERGILEYALKLRVVSKKIGTWNFEEVTWLDVV
jgi:hypothetical protein